jgi:hypothetical protein
LNIKGLTAVVGRQRYQNAQGLLYSNDLAPTDQVNVHSRLGPLNLSGFNGTTNDNTFVGTRNPYITSAAVGYMGINNTGSAVTGTAGNTSGSFAGFPGVLAAGGAYPTDNESLIHANINLFKIAGQPVGLGISRLFDGVQEQSADGANLTIPLFNRTIGIEGVRETQYFNGTSANHPTAFNVTVPVVRWKLIDLDFAYGKADNDFEYLVASETNPFARTYGEAIFDRPMALGSPMINGSGIAGTPLYMAAKQVYDWNGTVRVPISFLRRFPIDLRYYKAYGSQVTPAGGVANAINLGAVYSIGTAFPLSPGFDLSFKYGVYNVPGPFPSIEYFRAAANIGF